MELIIIPPHMAKEIIQDKELFNRIADEGTEISSYEMPKEDFYIGILVNGTIIGFWWLVVENSATIEIHCNILKPHRAHGVEAGHRILKFIKDHCIGGIKFHKINCKIPVCYPDVYHFTKKFGFKDEGIDRQSVIKNGEYYDRHLLGLLVEEIV